MNEINKDDLKKVSGGSSGDNPVVCGPLLCEHCGETCEFTYIPNEASGTQGDVRAYCSKCHEYQWIKIGAGR